MSSKKIGRTAALPNHLRQIDNVRREVIVPSREDLAEPVTGPDEGDMAAEMLAHFSEVESTEAEDEQP